MGSAGARRPAHPLSRPRRRRARRRRQEADPPHEGRGSRARVEDDRPLGRHRRVEPRRGRGTPERRRSRRDRLEDDRLSEQPHRLALDRRPHRRVRRARGAAPLRAESRPGARRRGRDDAGRDRVARRRRAGVHATASIRRWRSSSTSRSPPIIRTSRRRRSAITASAAARCSARGAIISPVVFDLLRSDRRAAADQVLGPRRGARHVDQRRRDSHRARGRRDGARLGAESLHALAERAREPRRRRQDRDAASPTTCREVTDKTDFTAR